MSNSIKVGKKSPWKSLMSEIIDQNLWIKDFDMK